MFDFHDALVRDVMNAPVTALKPETPLREAVQRMYQSGISCFVVDLGDPARGHGILTQKDVLGAMADHDWNVDELTVADAMSHPMVTIPATYNVRTCLLQMRMLGVRRAAVVDGTKILGMITFTDIFRRAVEKATAP
jgi:CBS domain-containing protein